MNFKLRKYESFVEKSKPYRFITREECSEYWKGGHFNFTPSEREEIQSQSGYIDPNPSNISINLSKKNNFHVYKKQDDWYIVYIEFKYNNITYTQLILCDEFDGLCQFINDYDIRRGPEHLLIPDIIRTKFLDKRITENNSDYRGWEFISSTHRMIDDRIIKMPEEERDILENYFEGICYRSYFVTVSEFVFKHKDFDYKNNKVTLMVSKNSDDWYIIRIYGKISIERSEQNLWYSIYRFILCDELTGVINCFDDMGFKDPKNIEKVLREARQNI